MMSFNMQYIIDIMKLESSGTVGEAKITRVATNTDPFSIVPALFTDHFVDVMFEGKNVGSFDTYASYKEWFDKQLIMEGQAEPVKKEKTIGEHVDPKHYQNYMENLQWLEAMNRLSRYEQNPEQFLAAVELQVRKYLDRLGQKDIIAQDLLKAVWYLKYMAAYLINDKKPILVKDIETLIKSVK